MAAAIEYITGIHSRWLSIIRLYVRIDGSEDSNPEVVRNGLRLKRNTNESKTKFNSEILLKYLHVNRNTRARDNIWKIATACHVDSFLRVALAPDHILACLINILPIYFLSVIESKEGRERFHISITNDMSTRLLRTIDSVINGHTLLKVKAAMELKFSIACICQLFSVNCFSYLTSSNWRCLQIFHLLPKMKPFYLPGILQLHLNML